MALTRITKGVIKPNENYDTHNINSTGIVTAIGLDISGDASIGGVLTYEDVTSIDSVGVITARDGIHVGAGVSAVGVGTFSGLDISGDIDVDGHTNLDNVSIAGVVTATTYYGNGSNLTGIDATALKDPAGNVKIQAQASGAIHTGISTFQDIDVDGHTNLDNVSVAGVSTFAGITTVTGNTLFAKQVNVSGVSTFQTASAYTFTVGAGGLQVNGSISGSSRIMFSGGDGSDMDYYAGGTAYSDHIFRTLQGGSSFERFRIGADGDIGLSGANYGTSGQVLTSGGSGNAVSWTTISGGSPNIGITTNLSGTFTASAGTPTTINTYGYGSDDIVVEYTVFIKNGSNFQSQKLLAMRDGTTIHSTQFAVMFSSSLLVQLDTTISGGNILLIATPETGITGSTTYKVKREVM